MAYKILREFSFIYYGRINEFVLFFVNIRQKLEVELRHLESKHNIYSARFILCYQAKNLKFLLINKRKGINYIKYYLNNF